MTDTQTLDSILAAASLWDLVGTEGKDAEAVFKKYARKVHPDMFQDESLKVRAQDAFMALTRLKERAEGKEDPSTSLTQQRAERNTIRGALNAYELKRIFHEGEIFTKYIATYNDNKASVLVSVLNDFGDTELADTHVAAFSAFENLSPEVRVHYPILVEDFTYQDPTTGNTKRAVVTRVADGFVPLSQVIANGEMLEKDVASLFTKMLIAVGNLHTLGLVHGAPTVDSFLINVAHQALILTDWQFSVPMGNALKHVPASYEDVYPDYALDGEPVDDRLDIAIIATMAERMLSVYPSREIVEFLEYCKTEEAQQVSPLVAEFYSLMRKEKDSQYSGQPTSRIGKLRNFLL